MAATGHFNFGDTVVVVDDDRRRKDAAFVVIDDLKQGSSSVHSGGDSPAAIALPEGDPSDDTFVCEVSGQNQCRSQEGGGATLS